MQRPGPDPVRDLLGFIDRSPTPYHAVEAVRRRLEAAGFHRLDEAEPWSLEAGARHYTVRGQGSLLAFEVGTLPPEEGGFRIVGAHTDSPNLRLKPRPDGGQHGYRQFAVEPYGAVLLHTWFDRDLSLAGRVTVRIEGRPRVVLVDFERPLLRIPNLAIHLQREIREQGLRLDPQQHAIPVHGLAEGPGLAELVQAELRVHLGVDLGEEDLLGFDLMAYDVQPAGRLGSRGEFVSAPRLDNLASCHAAVSALLSAGAGSAATRVIALFDHEEVGSRSAVGAAGSLLRDGLARVAGALKGVAADALPRALARSVLVSADMAHAVHPNYADRHDPGHRPVVGGGPVLKVNQNQAYATDATTGGLFAALCRERGIPLQHFASRSDLACGSTIGPISAARVGVPTVDVGSPMLAMHSCRELAGAADVEPMVAALRAFLETDDLVVGR